jgi:hypothetical protein
MELLGQKLADLNTARSNVSASGSTTAALAAGGYTGPGGTYRFAGMVQWTLDRSN